MEASMATHAIARTVGLDRILLLIVALALAAGGLATLQFTAAAQAEMIEFRILKVNCEEDPGDDIPPISEQIPEGCETAEGVDFTVSDTVTGNSLGECTTDENGRCTVMVGEGLEVTVEEDVTTGDPDFSPVENPITTTAVTEFAGAQFINVRNPEKPVEELPETGTGDGAMVHSTGLAGTVAVLVVVLALGGVLARRPGRL